MWKLKIKIKNCTNRFFFEITIIFSIKWIILKCLWQKFIFCLFNDRTLFSNMVILKFIRTFGFDIYVKKHWWNLRRKRRIKYISESSGYTCAQKLQFDLTDKVTLIYHDFILICWILLFKTVIDKSSTSSNWLYGNLLFHKCHKDETYM
jgi:hypothetical protein